MRTFRTSALLLMICVSVASAGTLVGVNFGAPGALSPANWTLDTGNGTINNLMDSTGAPTSISITLSSTGGPPLQSSSAGAPSPSTIPSDAPTLSNLQSNLFNSGPASLTTQFSGLTPNASYSVYAIGFRFNGSMDQTVTITGSGAPVVLTQSGPAFSLFFNGSIGSSSQTLESYAQSIQSSSTGTISILFTAGATRYNAAGVALSSTPFIPATPAPSSLILLLVGLVGGGFVFWAQGFRQSQRRRSATC
jgi:hypothetical protein